MRAITEADIVIVGGGTAGSVLAARLSENPRLRVLVLEAGIKSGSFVGDIPGFTMTLMGNPKADWCHMAEPDPSIGGRTVMWNAGRMLGGSSSINGMVYIRGLRRDYDDWAAAGCAGWAWNDVEPYFRRVERYTDEGSESLGREGPVPVSHVRSVHPLSPRFVEACAQIGINTLDDYNRGDRDGAFLSLTNQEKGQRASTAKSYLLPAKRRANLTVVQGAIVDKIVVHEGRASAVRYRDPSGAHEVQVHGEVLVSAGTVQSPLILMRSGIGRGEDLDSHGIGVVAHAPELGRNLQDHSGVMVGRFVNVPTYNSEADPLNGARHLLNYLIFRRGPLASAAVQAMAWGRSDPGLAEPDIHLNWFPYGIDYSVKPPVLHKRPCVSLGACVSRPWSRGRVELSGPDAEAKPVIRHEMLGDERDLATMVRTMKLMNRIFAAPALAPFVIRSAPPFDTPSPEEQLEELIRNYAGLGLHAAGTCRMGGDDGSVLDPELRVRGVSGLRVIDCSIMPRLISANTNAAVMMIAEKGADLVKQTLQ